jgi:23S rRNA (cytidine1920-2'-O)/16S rRNA (cytidine1409-2'-O)-methyltransferase
MKTRLDQEMVKRGLVISRSQAESYIKLGKVQVAGLLVKKPGFLVDTADKVELLVNEQYVSRAGMKLASVAQTLELDFKNKIVLDVGSSTGGFTDYALQHGAKKIIAVDVGTDQLHPTLHGNEKIELHEQTDIRNMESLSAIPDIVVIDVSFISLREVLPAVSRLINRKTQVVAMAKPQFEAGDGSKHKGVIKNDKMRRNTLKELENWIQNVFVIVKKADSDIAGSKGNVERFYLLAKS